MIINKQIIPSVNYTHIIWSERLYQASASPASLLQQQKQSRMKLLFSVSHFENTVKNETSLTSSLCASEHVTVFLFKKSCDHSLSDDVFHLVLTFENQFSVPAASCGGVSLRQCVSAH